MEKVLLFVTGPIGAGKTVFTNALLGRLRNHCIEYINTDIYYYLYFKKATNQLPYNYQMAKIYCKYKLNKARGEGKNVVWETVAAKEDKFFELQKFKDSGYKIIVFFITNYDLEKLTFYVSKRVREGSYDVPLNKIISRQKMLKQNYKSLTEASDFIIDIKLNDNGTVKLLNNKHNNEEGEKNV